MIDCKKCVHYPVCFAFDDICGEFEECVYYESLRPHGEWEWKSPTPETIMTPHCSNCGHMNEFLIETNFCPNCGATMQKEGENEWN